jgi:4'-phosphopantetheinyl transferase
MDSVAATATDHTTFCRLPQPFDRAMSMLGAIGSPATVLTLTGDDVHVWHVAPELIEDSALLRRCDAILSAEERARHARFVFPAHQHLYLVAHALVRTALSQYAPVEPEAWTFRIGPHGRPEVAGPAGVPPLRFNLSHTAGLIAVAVMLEADLGIDVEGIDARASRLEIAGRYFSPAETADLHLLPAERQPRAFVEYWTLKEAYIKATGLGLSMPLTSFAFTLGDPPSISFRSPDHGDPSAWHFARLDLSPNHLAALAVKTGRRPGVTIHPVDPNLLSR